MMRFRATHLLIVAVIGLFLLAAVGFLYMSKRGPIPEQPGARVGTERPRSQVSTPSGRERCMKKCAAIHKGYVYRAEQEVGRSENRHVEPEVCNCV